MAFIEWIQTNWIAAGGILYLVLSAIGQAVQLVNTPRAEKTGTVIARILAILRGVGIGARYADEGPTKKILPGQGGTGKVVVAVEDVK